MRNVFDLVSQNEFDLLFREALGSRLFSPTMNPALELELYFLNHCAEEVVRYGFVPILTETV